MKCATFERLQSEILSPKRRIALNSTLYNNYEYQTRILRKGPNWLRNGPRDVLLDEALCEVLKLLKLVEKVVARMD